MLPTLEQVRVAAYHRWERRGHGHGRDFDDWHAAEHDLLFALNYEVIAPNTRADEPPTIDEWHGPVCRFCEEAEPRANFSGPQPILPTVLGPATITADDLCDDCRDQFEVTREPDLTAFLTTWLHHSTEGLTPASGAKRLDSLLPLSAYKALTRVALSMLPVNELEYFPDALEWVCNPDPDCDHGLFGGDACLIHRRIGFPDDAGPWAALARRTDDEAPVPYLLLFLGIGSMSLEMAVPQSLRDEELDGEALLIPRIACPTEAFAGLGETTNLHLPVTLHRPSRLLDAFPATDRVIGSDIGRPKIQTIAPQGTANIVEPHHNQSRAVLLSS